MAFVMLPVELAAVAAVAAYNSLVVVPIACCCLDQLALDRSFVGQLLVALRSPNELEVAALVSPDRTALVDVGVVAVAAFLQRHHRVGKTSSTALLVLPTSLAALSLWPWPQLDDGRPPLRNVFCVRVHVSVQIFSVIANVRNLARTHARTLVPPDRGEGAHRQTDRRARVEET